jgi:hypothetical protein
MLHVFGEEVLVPTFHHGELANHYQVLYDQKYQQDLGDLDIVDIDNTVGLIEGTEPMGRSDLFQFEAGFTEQPQDHQDCAYQNH